MEILQNTLALTGARADAHRDLSAVRSERLHDGLPVITDPSGLTSRGFTQYDVALLQLWVHMVTNTKLLSKTGVWVNTYTGRVGDGLGLFPERSDHPMMHNNPGLNFGKFRMANGANGMTLPAIKYVDPDNGQEKRAWMSGDVNRSTENAGLATMHMMAELTFNKLLDTNIVADARADTLAMIALMVRTTMLKYGIDIAKRPELPTRVKLADTFEFNMGWGRWVHAQAIDFAPLFGGALDPSEAIALQMVDAPALDVGAHIPVDMQSMHHLPTPHKITDRTGGKAVNEKQCTWGQLREFSRLSDVDDSFDDMPTWLGLLHEARDNGVPGKLGSWLIHNVMWQSMEAESGEMLQRRIDDGLRDMSMDADPTALITWAFN